MASLKDRILAPVIAILIAAAFMACVIGIARAAALTAIEAQVYNMADATVHRWHLYGALLNVSDGAVIAQLPVRDLSTHEPLTFATPEDCIKRVMQIGPVPAHDGAAMVFRCVRDDSLPVAKP